VLDLGDLKKQADELRAAAEAEAARIVQEAYAERKDILEGTQEKGYETGYAAGHVKGTAEGEREGRDRAHAEYRERFGEVSQAFETALSDFEQVREAFALDAQEDGLRLVLEIARRVTLRSVEVDPDSLRERLAEAFGRVLDPSRLVVHIHPDDAALAREVVPGIVSRLGVSAQAEICEDGSLVRGDAQISTGRGMIDMNIATQLERIIKELMPGFEVENAATSTVHEPEQTIEPDDAAGGGSDGEPDDGPGNPEGTEG